ncbi:MAG TPA: response regulator transcription factor [Gaiellaceae bacterium]|nr:response regulator transcription factor [Gaiellaceae bacterium]
MQRLAARARVTLDLAAVREGEPQPLRARVPVRADADGDAARALIERDAPELVVLDVMLPGTDGLTLCRWIRGRGDLPVIMLTARGDEADRIVGLDLGADDYVTKPFSPRELSARVRSVLRRAAPAVERRRTLVFGELELDPRAREVRRAGAPLRLTAKEFDLLHFLASNPSQVFSRDQLMSRVWGYEAALDTGTVTVHVRRLRAKIERDPARPERLQTVWGAGYRFVP